MGLIPNQRRFVELDFIRTLALIGVLIIHITALTVINPTDKFTFVSSLFLNQLSKFCVPAFLFVSGILAFHSYKKSNHFNLLKRRLIDQIIPYVVWTLLGLVFFRTFPINYKGVIMTFLTGNGPFYQLYYIPLLFQMFIIVPLLIKFAKSKRRIYTLAILISIILLTYEILIIKNAFHDSIVPLYLQTTFFAWSIYFIAGIYTAQNYSQFLNYLRSKSIHSFIFLYLVAGVILVTDAYLSFKANQHVELLNYHRVSVLLYSFSSIGLLIKLGLEYMPKVLANLYTNSFGIYLVHVAIISILKRTSPIFFSNLFFLMVSFLITISASYIIVELIKRTPLAILLLGQKRMNLIETTVDRNVASVRNN